ncbi:uncharacterized protein [Anoplolepis gracilipes]|uniref:uncharacterized protein n=1 Tax=Anoplolepis gracilipes TaxID=354296 RepID=UPI003BA0D9DE
MERLDNLYYAQYANEQYASDESAYDLDNGQINSRDDESKYMQQRNKEESLYEDWLIQRHDLEERYQKRMKDVLIRTSESFVKYISKYKGNREVLGAEIFTFKITLVYCRFRRKWYFSSGYSFVPEVIDFKGKLESGTYHPISENILAIIDEMQRSINAYMKRFATVHQFIYNARRSYKDMQFCINSSSIEKIELIFTENAWPNGLRKLNIRDKIVVKLKLNKDIEVCKITCEYKHTRSWIDIKNKNNNLKKIIKELKLKLENFYNFPLEMAFKRFMENENYIEPENSESTN